MKPGSGNLKDKGNEYYSKGEYALASAMYRKYVKQAHPDNKNAYSNWSLCAFKLKNYQQCIHLCHQALELDPAFAKVYYRLVQAHLNIDDSYGAMVNAAKFCDLFPDDHETKQYKEIYNILKRSRDKICCPEREEISGKDSRLQLRGHIEQKKEESKGKNIFRLSSSQIDQLIKQGDSRQAINGLYQHLKSEDKGDQIVVLRKKITQVLRKIQQPPKQIEKSYKKDFSYSQKDVQSLNKGDKKEGEELESSQEKRNPKNQQSQQIDEKAENLAEKQLKIPQEMKNVEKNQNLYEKFFLYPLQKKSDVFEGFYDVILELIESSLPVNKLSQLLLEVSEKYPMFLALQLSLSEKQKKKLRGEMQKIVLVKKEKILKLYCA